VVIVGPTAVGKTEISLKLAERLSGEIISADSRLLYRGMDIGTDKPTQEERKRVQHHLIDVAEPDELWSLPMYQKAAYDAISDIHYRGKIPFLVGGSGQYIWAVIEGWDIPEVEADPQLRDVLQRWGIDIGSIGLYERLFSLDPKAAEKIEPQNTRRIIRALEVIFLTGKLFSAQRQVSGTPYQTMILGITRPRSSLYERIDARIDKMIDSGLIEEVSTLLDKDFSTDLPSLSAIGYRQVIEFLQGDIVLENVVVFMKRLTRQYVRRQSNWFKQDDPRIRWFHVGPGIVGEMEAEIIKSLNKWQNEKNI
jgi:tRNA dimethylallyltransferase